MSLAVIGAGFGRTGTMSMKLALEMLGFGRCHHMTEVVTNEEQQHLWREIVGGGTPDWDQVYAGYRATVDWPGAYYWRELSAHFPEAQILLTVRDDAEQWYASARNTIFQVIARNSPESIGVQLIEQRIFGGTLDDKARAIETYKQHIADVQRAFGEDRLLTYTAGDGWEPLCRFLERPVPDSPFPLTNTSAEYLDRHAEFMGRWGR